MRGWRGSRGTGEVMIVVVGMGGVVGEEEEGEEEGMGEVGGLRGGATHSRDLF